MADQPTQSQQPSDSPEGGPPETDRPLAPHPGSQDMPRWNVDDLPDAPVFKWRHWTLLLGPGLLMGGAAIGGGEWLTGPIVTARYGGAMLWLATLSILGQVIYNIEISRYTLYSGEPIFTGKFRTLPGPKFWIVAYLFLDFGSFFPYLAASAATPLFAAIYGTLPDPRGVPGDETTLRYMSYGIFLCAMLPLIFGGKIYEALRHVMTFKIVVVLGFLTIVAVFYSTASTWWEIGTGFVEFGNVPIQTVEDRNGNGILDEGEDWDGDGHADRIEPELQYKTGWLPADGGVILTEKPDAASSSLGYTEVLTEVRVLGPGDASVTIGRDDLRRPPDRIEFRIDVTGNGIPDGPFSISPAETFKKRPRFLDLDGDGIRDGDNIDNIFVAVAQGRDLPPIDWSLVAFLSALVAISGSGGLTNTTTSNYTRDQGWGMGYHVGAIPSMVGGHELALSHEGTVFLPDEESLPRWKRWYSHILRDQLVIWMPACFIGLALPSMLSVQFLARGTQTSNQWESSVMTAGALQETVGGSLGSFFWFGTILCGFLVLAPSMAVTVDGVIRRWVDAFWTALPQLRKLETKAIRQVYFGVLVAYALFGLTMLSVSQPESLLLISTTIYNFALGLSCWHVLWVTVALMPKPLRPRWPMRLAMFSAGSFFLFVATVSALQRFVWSS